MTSALEDRVYALLADARTAAASAALAAEAPATPRFAAGIFALDGAEKALAGVIAPHLLSAPRPFDLAAMAGELPWYDYAAAAAACAWAGDEPATLNLWYAAGQAAERDCVPAVAIAVRERVTCHALLLGNLEAARAACAEALEAARAHVHHRWRLRYAAMVAALAFAAGDHDAARRTLERSGAVSAAPSLRAFFAPIGIELALATADEAAIERWGGNEILAVAESEFERRSAAAAAAACVRARSAAPVGSREGAALRRALLRIGDAGEAGDLLSLAARFGDVEDASFAVERLRAAYAPSRPYLKAHALLARAHWSSRFGKRADAVDSAGDAARAFDAVGLRRWTDEAMGLLVHDDATETATQRRRPTAYSLTGREQQVAHLIRRGASNREVARTLQISEHTVERHVSSILSRLGLRSRWQIVDVATHYGDDASSVP